MKKFNIRKVLDGLKEASSSTSTPSVQVVPQENHLIQETIQSEHFQLCKTVRHGFPYQPSSMAFDPVQKILAIGTQSGALRLFGRPGVECYCQHESGAAVIQLQFLINEGALVSALSDDSIHLWNLRQKRPAILHSLKFNRERITFCHLPFQSKWLYIGTERGNIHIVNVESFTLSGYVIMWNKAIELSSKAHPGPVVHISDNPMDEGKVNLHYQSGIVVLWDLKSKKADYRYSHDEAIHSVAWHHEGKQFICSHSDGTLTIWNVRGQGKPVQTITPHGKQPKDGKKPEPCKPILKVEYKTSRTGEPFIIFSGGLSYDTAGRRPLTVMHGKSTAVLEMDYPIVDFLTLCETPYPNDYQEPYAVVVLLEKDLVVIDLAQNGYPIFENPYPLTIHESPVTCCEYFANCPAELIPALYSVGSRQKRQGYSKKEWPISGGNWGQSTQSYPEIIITGHADGTVKFWDASAIMLQVLYKLKTAKVFDRNRSRDDKGGGEVSDEDPFAIQLMAWCPESRMLCVTGVSANVIVYRFSKLEVTTEVVQLLEVRMQYELSDIGISRWLAGYPTPGASPQTSGPPNPHPSTSSNNSDGSSVPCLKVRSSPLKQSPGYQVDLVVQLVWVSGEPPQQITSLALSSSSGLVAFGNSNGLAVVDYVQKTVVLNLGTAELYGPSDPHQRQPRSPRKSRQPSGANGHCLRGQVCVAPVGLCVSAAGLCDINEGSATSEDRCKSPTSVQTSTHLTWSESCSAKSFSAKFCSSSHFWGCERCFTFLCLLPTVLLSVCPPRGANPLDHRDNSFSRSRSSSVNSIDKEAREAITSFHFTETFARKGDSAVTPCLYVGTSVGTILGLALTVQPAGEQRQLQSVVVSPIGMLVRLKGTILRMAFLDSSGSVLPHTYEPWYEANATAHGEEREKVRKRRAVSVSPSVSQDLSESQYAVVCSEKQAQVLSLPSQACISKHNITETSFILRADVVQMSQGACVACFCANGHIMTLSVPGLRPLMDVNYLPLTDMRIARTFCFTNLGQAMYLCSPTEIQRITYSQDICENLQEMLGELFTPVETPEAPNRGFFKGLFGGGAQSLDREELFGEIAAGKASRSLAQHIPGPGGIEGMKGAASGVVGELARARIALDERGQKLGELEERTAAMMASADSFSKHAHEMMLKCKDKKWYQF
uniref:Syntaxin-binding protein 5-like n=1 Tax=Tetraodon nigroviridis TaxID=99883 RepID=H3D3Y0_TETNG